MVEKLKHFKLKEKAKELLIENRFNKNSIKTEVIVFTDKPFPHSWKIDVVGFMENNNWAIECGSTSKFKLNELKKEVFKLKENQNDIKFSEVKHLPYEQFLELYSKIPLDNKTFKEKMLYLLNVYNKEVYEPLKDDADYDFIEYNQQNRNAFAPEHRNVWINIPDSSILNGKILTDRIHLGFVHEGKNIFKILIGFNGKKPCLEYLNFTKEFKEKIIDELNKLPDKFITQDGYMYKDDKHRAPPFPRNWEDTNPIRCNEMTIDDLDEMEERLKFWIEANTYGIEKYPVFDIVRIIITEDEVTDAIQKLKPLYNLLIKPETRSKLIIEKIKEIKEPTKWEWFIFENEIKDLFEIFQERNSNIDVNLKEFKKICRNLKSLDSDYKKYVES